MPNPRKRSRSRNKSKKFFGFSKRSRSRNPGSMRRRHRRNPSFGGVSTNDILKLGGGAFIGAVGSSYLSNVVMPSAVGPTAYAVEALAVLVLSWGAKKFTSDKVAEGVLAGGFGSLFKRIYDDNIGGGSLSGYSQRTFPLPTPSASGNYTLAAPGTPVVAPPAATSGAISGGGARFKSGGRFGRSAN